jgi:hypothetical protein
MSRDHADRQIKKGASMTALLKKAALNANTES